MYMYIYIYITCIISGWWFGTCLFFHILGISSSQLTKSIVFQRGRSTTNQKMWGMARHLGVLEGPGTDNHNSGWQDHNVSNSAYTLVNFYTTMEHQIFSWEISLYMVIFHSYVKLPEGNVQNPRPHINLPFRVCHWAWFVTLGRTISNLSESAIVSGYLFCIPVTKWCTPHMPHTYILVGCIL